MPLSHCLPVSILLFFIGPFSYAQMLSVDRTGNDFIQRKLRERPLLGGGETIEGTPYLHETFIEGTVYIEKGNYSSVPMRYDIFNDWMEFSQHNMIFLLDPDPAIEKIELGEYIFVVDKIEINGREKNSYLLLLQKGNISLMKKKTINFVKKLELQDIPAKYQKPTDDYFYKIGEGKIMKIESLKKMIASLPDKQETLNKFVKEEKISAKSESDLLKLITYYNSL